MKKILIVLITIFTGMPAMCDYFGMGSSNLNYLQTLQQQQFRMQEYNDFKDLQEQKQKHLKQDEEYVKRQQAPAVQTRTDAKFVNDNGQIKIEY